jgi:succinyl-diaminopimelate desuccinylase
VDSERFLAAASELLAVPSTADRPTDLQRALDFVVDFVGRGFTVERFESGGKPSALIYRGAQRPHFQIILNAHLDVVPAPAAQFRPRREGDRLYARGAQDMKVSALVEAQVFGELADGLPYPLGLQLVTDEEVGGRHGTLHQIEQGVSAGFVIIGEGSGLKIVTDSKGMITATLRAVGRSGHSAYPWRGDNALVKLQRSLAHLLAAYPVASEEAWRTTVNLARIETPNQAFNQIPALAEAWLDIRFPPEDTDLNGKTAPEIATYLAEFCEPGVTPVIHQADPPHHADQHGPEVRTLQHAIASQGYDAGFLRKHGAADGRFYYQRGTDAVIFGIGGDGLHGPDEYADTTTIAPYHQALREFLHSPAGPAETDRHVSAQAHRDADAGAGPARD